MDGKARVDGLTKARQWIDRRASMDRTDPSYRRVLVSADAKAIIKDSVRAILWGLRWLRPRWLPISLIGDGRRDRTGLRGALHESILTGQFG